MEIANYIEKRKGHFRTSFPLSSSSKNVRVKVNEIAFFYSMNKITFAVTYEKKEHIVDFSLEKLETELDPAVFFRTNRQTICRRDAIIRVEPWFNGKLLVTTNPEHYDKIIISREKARIFKEWRNIA